MRFIPTTTAKVESLKKQAKRLQRNGGGKHADLLNRVARTTGYEHWHHVTLCLRETEGVRQGRSLQSTIEQILTREQHGEVAIVGTGSETSTTQPFLLFSTGLGDAWLLDPIGHKACCLMWRGDRQSPTIRDLPERLEILWEGHYELRGAFFEVDLDHPLIGHRAIGGYPVDALREFLLSAQPAEESIAQVFGQNDAVPLTPDMIRQLAHEGWQADQLAAAARQGARYSPTRDAMLFPPMQDPK
ncbi:MULTISPECIES: hypothetical protein [unclassified Rhodanobacter]|uniref:hypothetical protein n=1 Tax=unclassified Rhodanobacter TaxID=2621553 RepID=UPI0007A9C598|nr:hypothetical protein [Rhodanobacter sp. FW510-R10]KZC30062.1 hypothetical protein RhoFW510R10_03565 [Rhodanobacter sp. FW510-R10]